MGRISKYIFFLYLIGTSTGAILLAQTASTKASTSTSSHWAQKFVDDKNPVQWQVPKKTAAPSRAAINSGAKVPGLGSILSGITTSMDYLQTLQDFLTMASLVSELTLGGIGTDDATNNAIATALTNTQTTLSEILSLYDNSSVDAASALLTLTNNLTSQLNQLTGLLGGTSILGGILPVIEDLENGGGPSIGAGASEILIDVGAPVADGFLGLSYSNAATSLQEVRNNLREISKLHKNEKDFYSKFIFAFVCNLMLSKKLEEIEYKYKDLNTKIEVLRKNRIIRLLFRDRLEHLIINGNDLNLKIANIRKEIPSIQKNIVLYESNFILQTYTLVSRLLDLDTGQYLLRKRYEDLNVLLRMYASIQKTKP